MADPRFVNVFLDTQFFDANQMDFANKTFEVLRSNVAAGHIHVFSTDVTRREIEKHVKERAAEAYKRLESVRKEPLLRNVSKPPFGVFRSSPTREDIEAVMLEQLADCWKNLRTTTLSVKDTKIESILENYFGARPPFGTGKKKSEFPDAIAAQALQSWCRANAQKMHIISGDGDWKAVCEITPELVHKAELAELLSSFPDAKVADAIRGWIFGNEESVKKAIAGAFRDYLFFRRDRPGEDIRTVEVTRLRVDDAFVIQLDNGVATVETPCKIAYKFTKARTQLPDVSYLITFGDPGPSYEGKSKTKAVAEMTLRYDLQAPGTCSIESVGIALRRPFSSSQITA